MDEILNPEAMRFFFGSQFRIDVAMQAMSNYEGLATLRDELEESIRIGQPHLGLQLVGYLNADTGFAAVAMMRNPDGLSGITFFADSDHRLFGGNTLVCVPLAFCSSIYVPKGEYLVYRHTYKRPRFSPAEIQKIQNTGSPQEQLSAFLFTKSREGYETLPGMSYVGITKRSWQARYVEHVESAMEQSSSTKFHEAIRRMQGQPVVHVHDVSAYGITESEARAYESELITKSTLWPMGLNMKK